MHKIQEIAQQKPSKDIQDFILLKANTIGCYLKLCIETQGGKNKLTKYENIFSSKNLSVVYQDGLEPKSSDTGSQVQTLRLKVKPGFHRHHLEFLEQFISVWFVSFLKANQILHEPYSGIQPMTAEIQ